MIVIRLEKDSENIVVLSKVLYYKKDYDTIVFYYNENFRISWKLKDDKEVKYCLEIIDEILNNNTFGSFVIMKDKVEPIPSSY